MPVDDDSSMEADPFSERKVFPDAAAAFGYRPARLGDVKSDCVVVLDTNVLLVPYTVSPKNLEEIRRTYESLVSQSRLVIPAQVAREFARNRALKLGELFQQLSNKRGALKRLQTGSYPLLETLAEYAGLRSLEKEIDKKLTEYEEAMDALLNTVKRWNWDDPVSLLYSEVFSADVIVELEMTDSDVQDDLERRAAAKLPPGYKDASKRSNSAGDLVIWHTILQLGAARKKPLLFVSGDGKPDWWHKSNGQPLYPRYELIDEFRRASNGNAFFITPFSEFLELFGADTAVVQEVKKEEASAVPAFATAESTDFPAVLHRAEHAVGAWLAREFPDRRVTRDRRVGGIDFVVTSPSGDRLGVDVKYFRQPHAVGATRIVREMAYRSFFEIQSGAISDYLLVVALPTTELAAEYAAVMSRIVMRGPPIRVVVGFMKDGQFEETTRLQTLGQGGNRALEA